MGTFWKGGKANTRGNRGDGIRSLHNSRHLVHCTVFRLTYIMRITHTCITLTVMTGVRMYFVHVRARKFICMSIHCICIMTETLKLNWSISRGTKAITWGMKAIEFIALLCHETYIICTMYSINNVQNVGLKCTFWMKILIILYKAGNTGNHFFSLIH